jgi:hypothetical protein
MPYNNLLADPSEGHSEHQPLKRRSVRSVLRNALQFDFNGAGGAVSPTHRLDIVVSTVNITVMTDPITGLATD